ncbi:hypothetical protein [Falsarthrobacter nasiphocae]|uniref:Uncharacterized protein n=1 Tax=Falsarthrobacter nasiphocae TaxID=189863 RepID=A0AAE3YG26_9MICC|nr:hypothetical protein [Falsarthrobacter nasiphocae]MDR6891582.1 hypothetical protein [Falsarthrobacter nasiphocae]
MTETMTVDVFGVTVVVEFASTVPAEDIASIRRAWSRCLAEEAANPVSPAQGSTPSTSPFAAMVRTLDADSEPRAVGAETLAAFGERLTSTITLAAIDTKVGTSLMFHAAGLADPGTRRAIALVAPSGTGKTTAARALGHDLAYLTDETVLLSDGLVVPYPKPLSVIDEAGAPKVQVSPDEAGLQATIPDATLCVIGLLERVTDPSTIQDPSGVDVTRVGTADAIHALVPQLSGFPALPRPFTQLIDTLKSVGGAVRLRYAESDALRPVVRELLNARPARYSISHIDEVPTHVEQDNRADGAPTLYRRLPARDAIVVDDRLLILLSDTLVEASDLGRTIWESCVGWKTLDEICRDVQDIHGEHPDAESIVLQGLEDLAGRHLVEISSPDTAPTP